jgi:regulatory protein
VTDPHPDALEAALAALARKERTTSELVTWLGDRGYDAGRIDGAIEELTRAGELDDERFARRYADDKRELRGWGAQRIAEALAARGIASDLVEEALQVDTDGAQAARACELLMQDGRSLADDSARARALGFLTRRGYGYEVAHEAIRIAARQQRDARPAA